MAVTRGEKWSIEVHPVNESGASSNEVSDIDVRTGGKLVYTAEVKDKEFIAKDVDHAVARVARSGFHTLHFIEGPRAALAGASYNYLKQQALKSGVELYHLSLGSMANAVIPFAPKDISLKDFAAAVSQFAMEARVKDETLEHLKALYAEMQ